MSSSVCQGLQSSCSVDPRVLRLKLSPSVTDPIPTTACSDDSVWLRNSFFQSPSNTSSVGESAEYVHPLTKRRMSMLSEKSLEMCTESLGSETGSDVGDYYYVSPATLHDKKPSPRRLKAKKLNQPKSFPPPLKSTGLQVRQRREGGRLVLEAVTAAAWKSVFHVERSGGRIRVGMMREIEEEEESVEEEGRVDDGEVAEVDDSGCGEEEVVEGNIGIVEGELGSEKFGRPRRCMDSGRSNKRLLNWEPFLVAT